MIQVSLIDTLEQFKELTPVWKELADKTEDISIYQTYEWLTSWWQSFGGDAQLYVLLVTRDTEPIGIAPLMITCRKRGLQSTRMIRFIGTPDIDYGDLIGPDKSAVTLATISYLWEQRLVWSGIDLSQIRSTSPTLKIMGDFLRDAGAYYRIIHIETSLVFEFDGTPESQRSFTSPRSEIMRRSARYFAKAGKFEVNEHRSTEEISRRLNLLFHYHVIRWQGTDTPSKFLDARCRDFYRGLVDSLAPLDRISLFELSLDGLPQAWCLDFDYRGVIYVYTPLYSMLHRHKAPGNLLFCLLPEFHIRQGYRFIDFGRGDQGNKVDFTNRSSKSYAIEIFRSPFSLAARNMYSDLKSLPPIQRIVYRPAVMSAKSQLQFLFSTHGFLGMLSNLFGEFIRKFVTHQKFYAYRIDAVPTHCTEPVLKVEFRKLTVEHLNEIASFLGQEARSDRYAVMAELFRKGVNCFAVYHENCLISIGWSMRDSALSDTDISAPNAVSRPVVLFDWYTSPLFEDQGVGEFRVMNELTFFSSKGLSCRVTLNSSDVHSRRIVKNLGFKLVGTDRLLTILGIQLLKPRLPMSIATIVSDRKAAPSAK